LAIEYRLYFTLPHLSTAAVPTLGQRPHHADSRVHQEVTAFGSADQATDCALPLLEILPGLGKFHDVVGGIAQSHELAPTR